MMIQDERFLYESTSKFNSNATEMKRQKKKTEGRKTFDSEKLLLHLF